MHVEALQHPYGNIVPCMSRRMEAPLRHPAALQRQLLLMVSPPPTSRRRSPSSPSRRRGSKRSSPRSRRRPSCRLQGEGEAEGRGRRGRRRRLGRLRGRTTDLIPLLRGCEQGRPLLIVGLGNPEPEHAGQRHNLGFDVALGAPRKRWELARPARGFKAKISRKSAPPGGPRVALLLPQTFTENRLRRQAGRPVARSGCRSTGRSSSTTRRTTRSARSRSARRRPFCPHGLKSLKRGFGAASSGGSGWRGATGPDRSRDRRRRRSLPFPPSRRRKPRRWSNAPPRIAVRRAG